MYGYIIYEWQHFSFVILSFIKQLQYYAPATKSRYYLNKFSQESNELNTYSPTYTGVGCHFLLQLMKVKSESEVAQSCPTQRPHELQPTRLLRPRDFPGRSTGVGCQCLLRSPGLSHYKSMLLCVIMEVKISDNYYRFYSKQT